MRKIVLLAILAAVAVTLFPRGAGAQASDYVVGPRDVLAITVSNEPTLSGKFTVVSDGTFTYPLIGPVRAGGLSVRAVERELTTKLADGYLEKPVVNVALDQFGSQRVLIVGEVKQAGSYPLTGRTTLLEALLTAGATVPTAGPDALVVRGGAARGPGAVASGAGSGVNAGASAVAGAGDVQRINLDALQRGDLSQNVELKAGDMVFVPRAEPPTPIYVTGLVRSPGSYLLPKGATVLQALAQAGGVTDQGSTRRLSIVRKAAGQDTPIELKAALHDLVLPGDTIVVRRRLF
jgi:polysaccharide export outer membrane protein